MPVKVPIAAPFEELVGAFARLWAVANPRSTGNVIFAVEDRTPDLAMRLVDDIRHDGPGVLFTGSLSGQMVRQAPRETAERQARRLAEMLEQMGWREPGSTPPKPVDPERAAIARRIADEAVRTAPADWPAWSTGEMIVAALAADRPDLLPGTYQDAGEAWARLDADQRAAVREGNPDMARFCEQAAASTE